MRVALALGIALLLTGCEDFWEYDNFQADFHYHYDFQPGGRIEVDNPGNGGVEIEGWDQNAVDVRGTKFAATERSLEDTRIDIHHGSDAIVVRTVPAPFHHAWARYTIRVPRQTTIERVSTVNGQILVRNVDSGSNVEPAHLKTVNGTVEAEDFRGAVDAQTVNGHIELRDVGGAVTMRAVNGRIEAERINGSCEAHTVNGPVTIELDHPNAIRVSTTNGAVSLTLNAKPANEIRAQTANGSITLVLPPDSNAHLHADTSHAPITTEFDVYEHVHGSFHNQNHLDGILGGGGPEIQLSTWNGRISVLKTL